MNYKKTILLTIISGFIISLFLTVSLTELKNRNKEQEDTIHAINDPNSTEPAITDKKINKNNIELSLKNTKKICVKATVSEPNNKNICWKEVEDDKYELSLYANKSYYVWLMDEENNIYKINGVLSTKQ